MISSLKENWFVLPKMIWGIWQIFTRSLESVKIGTLMASFCLKLKMYELKIYRGVMCHGNEEWCKNWRGIDFSFKIDMRNVTMFWLEHSKISQICTLMGCFWPKYNIWAKKRTAELCLIALKIDAKFEGKVTCAF